MCNAKNNVINEFMYDIFMYLESEGLNYLYLSCNIVKTTDKTLFSAVRFIES